MRRTRVILACSKIDFDLPVCDVGGFYGFRLEFFFCVAPASRKWREQCGEMMGVTAASLVHSALGGMVEANQRLQDFPTFSADVLRLCTLTMDY